MRQNEESRAIVTFVHLHGHDMFSMLDGYGKPNEIVERICELGHKSIAQTNHGNIFGHVPLEQAARKANINPIFGCEMYVVEDMAERKSRYIPSLGVNANPHVTVLAMN